MTDFEQDMEDEYQDGYEKSLEECKNRSKPNMTNSEAKATIDYDKEMEKMKKSNEALLEACRCAFDYSVPIEVRKDKVYQAIANATNNK